MGRGELVALRWEDIDLETGTVELDEPIVDVLRAHRQAQLERRMALGASWSDNGLVFCQIAGTSIDPDLLTKWWRHLVRRRAPGLDLVPIRLHDLRHSHCTQLLDAGVRPDVVTERLGHSSVAFTLQRYGHRYAGDQRTGLARLRSSDHAVTTAAKSSIS